GVDAVAFGQPAVLGVDEGDPTQVPIRARVLRTPGGATVGGGDDRAGAAHVAAVAHRPAIVHVDEFDRVHLPGIRGKALLVPRGAAVAGREDGARSAGHGVVRDHGIAGRPTVARVGEVDSGECPASEVDGVELPGAAAVSRRPDAALAQRRVVAQGPTVAGVDEIDGTGAPGEIQGRPGGATVARVRDVGPVATAVAVLLPDPRPAVTCAAETEGCDVRGGDAK